MKRIYCSVADRKGRRLWDGLVPGTRDRDALEALLRGEGWVEALPGGVLEDELYRLHAGACSATAHGDELDRVAAVAKGHDGVLDDAGSSGHLFGDVEHLVFSPGENILNGPLWDFDSEADKCLKKLVESIKQVWPVDLGASYADGTIDVESDIGRGSVPGLTIYCWQQDMGSGKIISTRVGLTP